MIRIISIFLLFIVCTNTQAQSSNDSILIEETLNGFNFFYQNQSINQRKLAKILEYDFEIFDTFESGREAKVFGNVFCVIGTTLIVIPFVTSAMGKETNWALTLAGTGFIGISIPLFKTHNKKINEAIQMHNSNLIKTTTYKFESQLGFGLTKNGLGISLIF